MVIAEYEWRHYQNYCYHYTYCQYGHRYCNDIIVCVLIVGFDKYVNEPLTFIMLICHTITFVHSIDRYVS